MAKLDKQGLNTFIRELDKHINTKINRLDITPKAKKVTITDTEGLFEATNVEDALLENKTSILNNTTLANQALTKANEAFLRGDNVKKQLVDKLISEGLNVSTNDTFEKLIGSITLGKKFATGILTGTQEKKYYPIWNGSSWIKSTSSQYCAKVNGLDFTPSMVLVFTYSPSSPMWVFRGYATTMFEKLGGFSYGEHKTNITVSVNHDGSLGVDGSKLYKGGFDIMFGGFSSFEQNKGILWVAYE